MVRISWLGFFVSVGPLRWGISEVYRAMFIEKVFVIFFDVRYRAFLNFLKIVSIL